MAAAVTVLGTTGCGAKPHFSEAQGSVTEAAWSPDGRSIEWVEVAAHAGARIWVGAADLSHARAITPPIDALGQIAWLPGKRLIYWADARLFLLKPGGQSSLITDFGGDGFTVDARGTRIVTGDPGCSSGCNGPLLVLNLNGDIVRKISRNAQNTSPSLSPTGTQVVFARNFCELATGRCERPAGIWVASIASGQLKQIRRNGCCPNWSPDGRSIAYINTDISRGRVDDSLRVVPAVGVATTYLPHNVSEPLWSSDSQSIAVAAGPERRLMIVDVKRHRSRGVTGSSIGTVIGFAWSPDSADLLVAARPAPRSCSSLWLVNTKSGAARLLRRCQ
jgi:hypothetical protein